MKKDEKLESVFDEYFESSKAPDESVLTAAKNSMKKAKAPKSGVWKRVLVSAACAVFALLFAVGLIYLPSKVGGIIAGTNGGDTADLKIDYYSAEGLSQSQIDFYSDGAPSGIGFVKKLDLARNFSVNAVNGYSSEGELNFVEADISAVVNGSRHDAVVYAEYTQKNSACELFKEYYGGEKATYRGLNLLCFDTEENGEPVKKLTFERKDVKYYVAVASSDEYAYTVWLDLIIN